MGFLEDEAMNDLGGERVTSEGGCGTEGAMKGGGGGSSSGLCDEEAGPIGEPIEDGDSNPTSIVGELGPADYAWTLGRSWEEFLAYFVAHTVARISDLVEMPPAFDDDGDDQPQRRGGARQRDEEGEEIGEGGRDDGGGGGGGGRGGFDRGRGGGDRGRGDGGDRGRIALGAGGVGRVGAVLAMMDGIEDDRRPTQRRRYDVLPPPPPQIGTGVGGTTTQVPV
ncbi:uncharacterized protein LOC131859662 [Cryptomeria japonica]|uniref:uncharacterized protein LOC131859662 n=1 Tax=Cryptomeria japonica TaxID=3369 RepID=UPI0027D9FF31|nr:uncharacterized protein LOC131859662 [Cryptomeria japonica]